MKEKKPTLEFRGTKAFALIPLFFLMSCTFYFMVIARTDDIATLPMGVFLGLIMCSFFAKNINDYWNAVIKGMSDEGANMIVLILLFAGIYSAMMSKANVAGGFVWLMDKMHISGGMFCVFTYIAVTVIATSTGTSIGSILTAVAIMYPTGVMMGVDNIIMLGAIISGALTGDTIGPVSDCTIAACITQDYLGKEENPDIPGSVISRSKYSLAIAGICIIIFAFLGSTSTQSNAVEAAALIAEYSYGRGLLMMFSVLCLLIVAVKTKNTFISITVGVVSGTIIGLVFDIFPASAILAVEGESITGFLAEGIVDIMYIVIFSYGLFGMIGVMNGCGLMKDIVEALRESKFAGSPMGTELIIMLGTIIGSISMGGDNSPAIMLFGPVANELGQSQKIHPYRRADLLCGFSSTLSLLIPFSSYFIFTTVSAANAVAEQYPFIRDVTAVQLPRGMVFCIVSWMVYIICIFTGWGRRYEGENSAPMKRPGKK